MKCPLLAAAAITALKDEARISDDCLKEECAWWNHHFGMCLLAVNAYLRGQQDYRREREVT